MPALAGTWRRGVTVRDWYDWHADYDNPRSSLSTRLAWVQAQIRAALDRAPAGPLRVISLCAGQGQDLIGALADHPRRDDVSALLVELDPRNTEVASGLVAAAGLTKIAVVTGDASLTSQYVDYAPADLVLVCGVFGNLTNADIERTIGFCAQLCAAGGSVVWTRGRWAADGDPDLVPQICAWFEERDFERVWLAPADHIQGVGTHRRTAAPIPLDPAATMFAFTNHDPGRGPRRI